MENWRLVINEPFTGAMNMAVDEAIMTAVNRGMAPPTIRFYQWNPPAISLGYFQSLEKEVDLKVCRDAGIDVVRRLTGGRAVLHHHELTYSLIAPEDNEKVSGSVLKSYLKISGGLVSGLSELGVIAKLSEGKQRSEVDSAACFDAPSWYEMVVDGKKLIGSAQTRRSGCLLQHGSVLVKLDKDLLFSILNFPDDKLRDRAKAYFRTKATCLEEVLGRSPGFEELCQSFKRGFEAKLVINLREQGLSSEELALAQELNINKYGKAEWNGRK